MSETRRLRRKLQREYEKYRKKLIKETFERAKQQKEKKDLDGE